MADELEKIKAERDKYKQMLIDGKKLCTCERITLRTGSATLCFICDRESEADPAAMKDALHKMEKQVSDLTKANRKLLEQNNKMMQQINQLL
jgi:DNA repair ATPase RecN